MTKRGSDRIIARNKTELWKIAAKIERRETLSDRETLFAASALRCVVLDEPVFVKGGRGRPSRLPDSICFEFVNLLAKGFPKYRARETLAARFNVDEKAIRNNLRKNRRELQYFEAVYRGHGMIPPKNPREKRKK